jgi:hypothetical protein
MPLDILTGQSIDVKEALAWQNSKEFHHFFPQAFLKANGVVGAKASSLANMVYLSSASNKIICDRAPSAYVKELLDSHGDEARKWLASNLVDDAAINAALKDDFDGFLNARAEVIGKVASKLAGW